LIGVIWKPIWIDSIASFSTHGGSYGEGGGLFGMLSMIDFNLGLHHVQQRKSQKSYKEGWKNITNAILNCNMSRFPFTYYDIDGSCNFQFLQEVDHHYHHLHEQDQFIQAWVTWTFVVWIDYLSKFHLTF